MTRAIAIGVAACLAGAGPAHAETHALAAAKKVLPANQTVIAASFTTIAASGSFQTLWAGFVAKHADTATALDKIKKTCGVDPLQSIDSLVVAMPDLDSGAQGLFVVSFKGVAQKDVDACLTKLVAEDDKKAVKITTDKGVTQYDSGKDQLFMRWLDKTTVAFAPAGKDQLVKMTAGGMLANKGNAAALKGFKGDATVAILVPQTVPLDTLKAGVTASMGYGSATLAAGNVKLDVHLVTDADKTATDLAATANTQLAAVQGSGGPPMLANILKSIAIKNAGKELVVTAAMTEKELLQLLALAGITASP